MKMAPRIRLAGVMLAAASMLLLFSGSGRSGPTEAASTSPWQIWWIPAENLTLEPHVFGYRVTAKVIFAKAAATNTFGIALPYSKDLLNCKLNNQTVFDVPGSGTDFVDLEFQLVHTVAGGPYKTWYTGGKRWAGDRNVDYGTYTCQRPHADPSIRQEIDGTWCPGGLNIAWEDAVDGGDCDHNDCVVALCAEPLLPAVGGLVGMPVLAGSSPEEAGPQGEGSGRSASSVASLAAGLTVAALLVGGGAWYARRRWRAG